MDFSFIPAIFELTGIYLLGKKHRSGFILNTVGGLCWILYSVYTKGTYGLILVCSVAAILNIKGFILWRQAK